jgi:4-amino-4-deoxy-L-arabinose transferase-like glycosyltransferase
MRDFALKPTRFLGLPAAAIVLLAVGLAARLAWALLHPIDAVDDFLEYDVLARNVAFEGYYGIDDTPGTFRPPGWPYFLAGVYWLFGTGQGVAAGTVALFSWGTAFLGALVAYRLLWAPFALLSTAFLALMPSAVLYSGVLGTEFPSAFLMMAIVLMLTARDPRLPLAVGLGVTEGALLLTRTDLGVAMGVAILVVFIAKATWRSRLLPAFGLAVLCGALVLVPWVVRNHNEFGEVIPFSSNAGVTFYSGTLDSGYTVSGPIFDDVPPDDEPAARDRFYFEKGFENVKDDPVQWLKFNVERFAQGYGSDVRILAWGDAAPFGSVAYHASDAVWHLAALLGFIGLLATLLRRRPLDPAWLAISAALLVGTLLKMTFLFDGRHRVPLVPLIALLAGLGAQVMYDALFSDRDRNAPGDA